MSEDLHGRIDELIADRDTVIEYNKHLIAERDEARRIARRLIDDTRYYQKALSKCREEDLNRYFT